MQFFNLTTIDNKRVSLDIIGNRMTLQPQSDGSSGPRLSEDDLRQHIQGGKSVNAEGYWLLPGMIDAHVHSREPGHEYKEDWQHLARSAFKGGVVGVCDMPNTSPPTTDRQSIEQKMRAAGKAGIAYRFFLGVTEDNIGECRELLRDDSLPLCGVKIYYGQTTGTLHFSHIEKLAALATDKILVFHSEDQCCMDDNLKGAPPELTFKNPEDFAWHSRIRDTRAAMTSTRAILEWAKNSPARIHIAHISTPEEVDLIIKAREQGVRVTCEIAPHHLIFSTKDYKRWGGFLKMNPPIRDEAQVERLRKQFAQREIEVYATDHAPHTLEEKRRADYLQCPSGVPALEFFAPLLFYTAQQAGLDIADAVAMASSVPSRLFGMPELGTLKSNAFASFSIVKPEKFRITERDVQAKCGWSPYLNLEMPAKVFATWHLGELKYLCGDLE
ncbi:MAG: amidohydrolase family protein [Oligoflexales bacterium]